QAGRQDISSAADAAEALRPLAGDAATVFMALGLIGTGLLAVPILTGSAAYAVCETFGWKCSLDAKPGKAKEFYSVLGIATGGGCCFSCYREEPVSAWRSSDQQSSRNVHGIRDNCLAPLASRFVRPSELNHNFEGARRAFLNLEKCHAERTLLPETSGQLFIF